MWTLSQTPHGAGSSCWETPQAALVRRTPGSQEWVFSKWTADHPHSRISYSQHRPYINATPKTFSPHFPNFLVFPGFPPSPPKKTFCFFPLLPQAQCLNVQSDLTLHSSFKTSVLLPRSSRHSGLGHRSCCGSPIPGELGERWGFTIKGTVWVGAGVTISLDLGDRWGQVDLGCAYRYWIFICLLSSTFSYQKVQELLILFISVSIIISTQ